MIAQKVLRLQISVQVVVLMHVAEALEGLENYVPDQLLREEFAPLTHQLIYVQVQVLENELQCVLLETDLVEAHNIGM